MGLIQDLDTYCAFDLQFDQGSLRDRISGNIGTVTAPVQWTKAGKQRGISVRSTGLISFVDTVPQRLAGGQCTVIVVGDFNSVTPLSGRIAGTRDAGAAKWEMKIGGAGLTISAFDGTLESGATRPAVCKCLAFTLVNGAKPTFYADGISLGLGANNLTFANNAGALSVGNIYAGTTPLLVPLSRVLGYSRALTAQQIAQIYEELMAAPSYGNPKHVNIANASKAITKTVPVLHWALDKPINGTIVPDLSGNGRNGTATNVGVGTGLFGRDAATFNTLARSAVTLVGGLTNTIASNNQHSVSFWVSCKNLAVNPVVMTFSAGNYYFEITPSTVYWNVGGSQRGYGPAINYGGWHHIYAEKTGAGDNGNVYFDNIKLTPGLTALSNTPATGDIVVGDYAPNPTLSLQGSVQDLRIYSQNLSASERTDLYKTGARKLNFYLPMGKETEVTLADVSTKNAIISNTPFKNLSTGTFKVTEPKAGKKYIISSGTQYLAAGMNSDKAFGTWIVEYYHPPAGGGYIALVCNNITDITDASRQVYMLGANGSTWLLGRYGAAGNVTLMANTADAIANTYYTFAVTRNNAGVFTVYRRTNFGAWALATINTGANPTAGDLTYTTSSNIIMANEGASNVGFGSMRFYEGVLSLGDLQEMYP